ncbi:MAG: hypothetical protein KGL35_29325 [Bradyrhizobium sp.]|nr:hypothetical protein [Bradyrhizobium sp.]
MREKQGQLAGEIKGLGHSITRLVGIVEGHQRTNETAHRAQDDRMVALHGDVRVALARIDRNEARADDHEMRLRHVEGEGIRDAGVDAAHRRLGEWLRAGFSAILGAGAALIGQAFASGRH